MFVRIFNLVFSLLFLLSAVLQYNDPDPYLWIPIYLYGAVLSFLAFRNRYFPKLYLAGIAVYGVYAIYLFFTNDGVLDWINQHDAENIAQSMKATRPWIEDAREFFGLVILMMVLSVNYALSKKKKQTK